MITTILYGKSPKFVDVTETIFSQGILNIPAGDDNRHSIFK